MLFSYSDHHTTYMLFTARGLCCRPVSVRPSVTLVDCIQTAEDIVKLLSRSGSPIILVFFYPERQYSIPRGTPAAGVQNIHGVGNIYCDFRPKSPFISETVRDRTTVAMER